VLPTAVREDQSDVVVLLVGAEAEDFVDHGGERGLRGERAMAAQRIKQARLAEFLAIVVEGLGDAVCVEGESVAGRDLAFADFAIPLLENAEDRGSGAEAGDAAVAAE
jgi:hypothetical protein